MRAVDDGFDAAAGYRSVDEDELLNDILGESMASEAESDYTHEDDDMDFDIEPTDEELMAIEGEEFDSDLFSDDKE
jgi:hypothetical protein